MPGGRGGGTLLEREKRDLPRRLAGGRGPLHDVVEVAGRALSPFGEQRRARGAQRVERAALDEPLEHAAVDLLAADAVAEVGEVDERPALARAPSG